MPIIVPTPGEVRSWFEELVSEATGCAQQMAQDEFNRHLRGALHRNWEAIAPGLDSSGHEAERRHVASSWAYERKRLQIDPSVFLIQAATGFIILNHEAGQEVSIPMAIKSWAAPLAAWVPAGATTSLLFEFPQERVGPGQLLVECMVRGIVVSASAAGH